MTPDQPRSTGSDQPRPQNRWLAETGGRRGAEYADRFDALEASGAAVHGEADALDRLLAPGSALVDGGCGTGRVGRELARRGHRVVGVDLDASMVAVARERDPGGRWLLADLLDVSPADVGAPVDAVVLAGNVLVYLTPGTEEQLVRRVAGWLRPGGLLVCGFAADRHVSGGQLRQWAAGAGLTAVGEWAGWDDVPDATVPADGGVRRPDRPQDGDYLVVVHRR